MQNTRVNDRIRAYQVRVVNGVDNSQLGVLRIEEALSIAKRLGMDLVEISPNAKPPVCKILDYGKFKYEQSKQKKERSKLKTVIKTKEIKFHISTESHDYGIKIKHASDFLLHGNKVMVRVDLRGRELAHRRLAFDMIKNIIKDLSELSQLDSDPKGAGRSVLAVLSPLAKNKAKLLKLKEGEEQEDDAEGTQDDVVEEKTD